MSYFEWFSLTVPRIYSVNPKFRLFLADYLVPRCLLKTQLQVIKEVSRNRPQEGKGSWEG